MPKYSPKTMQALDASIEHWQENLAKAQENQRLGRVERTISMEAEDCALCGLYNTLKHLDDTACRGCPVADKTGQRFCKGTPFHAASRANNTGDLLGTVHACAGEVDFLENLRAEILAEDADEAAGERDRLRAGNKLLHDENKRLREALASMAREARSHAAWIRQSAYAVEKLLQELGVPRDG